MNYNNLTIGIVTFKSEKVIFNCLKSIKKFKNIIIFDNSNDKNLRIQIKKKFPHKPVFRKIYFSYMCKKVVIFK